MSPTLSACVLACNEEDRLPRCLDSIDWVDEVIVVVDAKSVDGSEKLARERGARVEVRPYRGDLDQKSYCTGLATSEWVLVIDPDEEMPPRLSAELRSALEEVPARLDGFELDRRTWHLGRWIDHGDYHPDWTLRVFRRGHFRWTGADPHGRVVVDGGVERLRPALEHYSYRDLSDQIERIQSYSDQAARGMFSEGRGARRRDMWLRPPARFLRAYLWKRGFLDGTAGLVIAGATAFHVFLKYAKLWELQRAAEGSVDPAERA